MPSIDILRESEIKKSFRVEQVLGMFDVPESKTVKQEWSVNIPIEDKPWLIGAIVGPSGSGKTTIACELFSPKKIHAAFDWGEGSILEYFPQEVETKAIVAALSSVGLSSPPHWLKPFHHLSNGQKFRCELARLLVEERGMAIFDEYTSVVDRDVAKVCSAALSKTIRKRQGPRFVAISCHFDILDWLQPDWVFDVAQNCFEWRRLRRRPEIKLKIYEASTDIWKLFKGHHYLSASLHPAAKCFVATWNETLVGFSSFIHLPHAQARNLKREHRTVVLPDFQGVGIGNALSEVVAGYCLAAGNRFVSTSSHPAIIWHRARSPLWKCTNPPRHNSTAQGLKRRTGSSSRLTASFEFIGKTADTGCQNVTIKKNENTAPNTISEMVRRHLERRKEVRVSSENRLLEKKTGRPKL